MVRAVPWGTSWGSQQLCEDHGRRDPFAPHQMHSIYRGDKWCMHLCLLLMRLKQCYLSDTTVMIFVAYLEQSDAGWSSGNAEESFCVHPLVPKSLATSFKDNRNISLEQSEVFLQRTTKHWSLFSIIWKKEKGGRGCTISHKELGVGMLWWAQLGFWLTIILLIGSFLVHVYHHMWGSGGYLSKISPDLWL